MGVVSAACQMAGQAVSQRQLGRQQRAADRAGGARNQCLAPRQAHAAQGSRI